jgi:hypothetical protein
MVMFAVALVFKNRRPRRDGSSWRTRFQARPTETSKDEDASAWLAKGSQRGEQQGGDDLPHAATDAAGQKRPATHRLFS